ncbi:pseudouridine synthase [Neptunitalea lumnitzerae]|uniref:pseudouridine synthase n=1 Tax=Neptunitalea lumnitzerae TaxID=2965509 RepID=UPI002493C9DF|nr:pseudouridine synthase [Neptunitalea sp. Y10]
MERERKEIIHKYYKLFKPYGYISQLSSNDARQLRKKKFLKDLENVPSNIMPIGRLDEKSEGLLLLTTDGVYSDTVNRSGIEKEYVALLDGDIDDNAIEKLRNGVLIGINGKKYQTKPCEVKKLTITPTLPTREKKIRDARHGPVSWIKIVITEGKFRQIRKMTSGVGFPTLRLVRVRVGSIKLDDMQPGDVVECNNIEIKQPK